MIVPLRFRAGRAAAIGEANATMVSLRVNGDEREIRADPSTPLLWVLRDELRLTGTKFGCGIAVCGACTVMVGAQAMRSCTLPVGSLDGKVITTIEGLGDGNGGPHALQRAWIEHQVPQCGYCQSGFLMAAAALLAARRRPTDADIDAAIGNLCRCGTYPAMRAAIRSAARALATS